MRATCLTHHILCSLITVMMFCCWIEIVNLLIMQFSPSFCKCFLSLTHTFFQYPVSIHSLSVIFLSVKGSVPLPYKTKDLVQFCIQSVLASEYEISFVLGRHSLLYTEHNEWRNNLRNFAHKNLYNEAHALRLASVRRRTRSLPNKVEHVITQTQRKNAENKVNTRKMFVCTLLFTGRFFIL